MKKHPYLSVALLCVFAIVINGCKSGTGDCEVNTLQHLNEIRLVYFEGEEIYLSPFEMFNIVRYDSLDNGLWTLAQFTILDPIQKQVIYQKETDSKSQPFDAITPYSSMYVDIENDGADKKAFSVKLELLEGKLTRRIKAGETYKLKYYFHTDHQVMRDNVPTEYRSDFRIIDIVPVGQKFRSQESLY